MRLQLSPLPAPSHLHHHGHLCQALMDQYFQQLNDCKPCGDNLCGRYPYHRHYCGIPGGHKYFTTRSVVKGHSNFSPNYDKLKFLFSTNEKKTYIYLGEYVFLSFSGQGVFRLMEDNNTSKSFLNPMKG